MTIRNACCGLCLSYDLAFPLCSSVSFVVNGVFVLPSYGLWPLLPKVRRGG